MVLVFGFFMAGIISLAPKSTSDLPEDGQGGPTESLITAELPPAAPLSGDRFSDLESQTRVMVANPDRQFVYSDRLGPLEIPGGRDVMIIGLRESFYDALLARSVPHADIMALVKACKSFRDLRKVRSGEKFMICQDPDGGLRSLGFDLDLESYVTWQRQGDTFVRTDGTYPVSHNLRGVSGVIHNSLYASLQELDAPASLAAKMNDIMGWEIDFKRDLRPGDTFAIIYDEVWKDGQRVRTGAIKALELVNRGRKRQAFRFETTGMGPGYFDAEGHNLQKQLMRAPLEYSRISSTFTYRRYHPVLKRWMPHLGVDYAAPLGTPVRAGGDGVVVDATRKHGNGRYVHIRHNNSEYETYYLHLSRFAKGVRRGKHVRQGDIIGFVGATGYATGPHLDYRVKRHGKFVNPRSLKLPAAHPVAKDLMTSFDLQRDQLTQALEALAPGQTRDLDLALLPAATEAPLVAASQLPLGVRAAQ